MLFSNKRFVFRAEGDDAGGGTPPAAALPEDTLGTGNDARVAALNAIMDKNDVARADEFMDVADDDKTVAFVPPELPPAESELQPEIQSTEISPPPASEPSDVKKFKIKVNGKELELTEEEVLERASKVESADEYLRIAKASAPTTQPSSLVAKAGPTEEELQRARDEEDRALARALQVGTEEEAVAAIRKVRAASAGPSVSPDDVARTVDQRLAFNTAIDQFSKDFPDIWKDPVLKDLAFRRDKALLAAGDSRPYLDRYTDIGKGLMEWVGNVAPKVTPADDGLDAKHALKAAAPQVPITASGKQKPAAAADDKEESSSEVIANMAKSRGGPQWMRS